MSFTDTLAAIPGLTHYYPLDQAHGPRDVIGGHDGKVFGGVDFTPDGAVFDGDAYVEIADHDDFSVVTRGALSILAFQAVADWAYGSDFSHWMGKGTPNDHEWVFRHYREDSHRPKRTSFYHFNAWGGLGAGSYFQDDDPVGQERVVVARCDLRTVDIWKDGQARDADPLSGYNIRPSNEPSPVRIGTRDLSSGFHRGTIRRVAFFNRLLTAGEIAAIHDARDQADGGTVDPGHDLSVTIGDATLLVDGVDVERQADFLVVYTDRYDASPTNQWGVEVVVRNGEVASVNNRRETGDARGTAIPDGAVVLSGHGAAGDWLETNAVQGAQVSAEGFSLPGGGGGTGIDPAQVTVLLGETRYGLTPM